MVNTGSESSKGLENLTPDKKLWVAVVVGVLAILLLVALIEYDPDCLHKDPPVDKTLLLNKGGLWVADFLYAVFGIAAWLLPWLLGTVSFLWATRQSSKEKTRKLVTIFAAIVSISVLANVRHYSLDPGDRAKAFAPDTFRHGAGGSIGAIVYSGLPWDPKRGWIYESKTNGWKKTPSDDNGFFLDWMGALGTSVLMAFVLMGSLCVHFSMEPLKLLGALVGLGRTVKEQLPKKADEEEDKEKVSESKESQVESGSKEDPEKKTPKKRWKFSWFEKEKEDDLLFGDVSLQKESGAVTQSEISSSKKTKPKKPKAKDEPLPEEPAETPEPIDDESSPNEKSEPTLNVEKDPDPQEDLDAGMDGFKVVRAAKTEKAADLFPERKGDYHFPTPDLLMDPPEVESSDDEDHMLKAKRLKETLSQFKIEVEMGEVHTGPVITRIRRSPGCRGKS